MKIGNLEVYGIIYKIRNKVNNKIYIGQTIQKKGFNDRYCYEGIGIERVYNHYKSSKEHNHKSLNKHLLSSIDKYGLEAFEISEIFDIAFSKEELDIKEDIYIKLYNSLNGNYGYNHKGGGANGKLPENVVDLMGKPIIQLSLDGEVIKEWATTMKALRYLNATHMVNTKDFNNIKTSYGFIWVYKEDYNEDYTYVYQKSKYDNSILLDIKGNFIKEFLSKDDVIEEFNISYEHFRSCVNNKYLLKNKYNLITKESYVNDDYIILTPRIISIGENHHNYGKKATMELRKKLSEAHIGLDNHQSQRIICITTGEVFNSIKEASIKHFNKRNNNISSCCSGQRKSAGKLSDGTPLKWMYYDEYIKENQLLIHNESLIQAV